MIGNTRRDTSVIVRISRVGFSRLQDRNNIGFLKFCWHSSRTQSQVIDYRNVSTSLRMPSPLGARQLLRTRRGRREAARETNVSVAWKVLQKRTCRTF